MVVVRSGKDESNQWTAEEHNVYEDYKRVFGKEPPMITGVGIMTDSDDTKESTVSFYGDISFKKKLRVFQISTGSAGISADLM